MWFLLFVSTMLRTWIILLPQTFGISKACKEYWQSSFMHRATWAPICWYDTICIWYIYNIIHIFIYISIKLSKQLKVQNITIKSSFGDNICLDHLLPNKNTPNMLNVCLHSKLNFVVVFPLMRCCPTGQHSKFFPGVAKKIQEPEENRPVFPGMKQSCVQIYLNAGLK